MEVTLNGLDNGHIEASTAGKFAANQPRSFMPTAEAAWSVSGHAKARAKGRRNGSTCCLVLCRDSVTWKYHALGVTLSRNVLPSVICVAKLLGIVGNLCHVLLG